MKNIKIILSVFVLIVGLLGSRVVDAMFADHYEALGVAKNATLEEIKKAYRDCAIKYRPDKNQDDENANEVMFQKACDAREAFKVLSDQAKRSYYDKHEGYIAEGPENRKETFNLASVLKDLKHYSGHYYAGRKFKVGKTINTFSAGKSATYYQEIPFDSALCSDICAEGSEELLKEAVGFYVEAIQLKHAKKDFSDKVSAAHKKIEELLGKEKDFFLGQSEEMKEVIREFDNLKYVFESIPQKAAKQPTKVPQEPIKKQSFVEWAFQKVKRYQDEIKFAFALITSVGYIWLNMKYHS